MFKFTIRDMLWLTVLAAVAVAWWVDRSRLAERLTWQPLLTRNQQMRQAEIP